MRQVFIFVILDTRRSVALFPATSGYKTCYISDICFFDRFSQQDFCNIQAAVTNSVVVGALSTNLRDLVVATA